MVTPCSHSWISGSTSVASAMDEGIWPVNCVILFNSCFSFSRSCRQRGGRSWASRNRCSNASSVILTGFSFDASRSRLTRHVGSTGYRKPRIRNYSILGRTKRNSNLATMRTRQSESILICFRRYPFLVRHCKNEKKRPIYIAPQKILDRDNVDLYEYASVSILIPQEENERQWTRDNDLSMAWVMRKGRAEDKWHRPPLLL
ncbi:hypothetical protein BX666DRAFT_694141 [Dichotomocladium elegans]|nr:hypothetical protein BX666DRAFT_694141 [Dichotomocladium elegans]